MSMTDHPSKSYDIRSSVDENTEHVSSPFSTAGLSFVFLLRSEASLSRSSFLEFDDEREQDR